MVHNVSSSLCVNIIVKCLVKMGNFLKQVFRFMNKYSKSIMYNTFTSRKLKVKLRDSYEENIFITLSLRYNKIPRTSKMLRPGPGILFQCCDSD